MAIYIFACDKERARQEVQKTMKEHKLLPLLKQNKYRLLSQATQISINQLYFTTLKCQSTQNKRNKKKTGNLKPATY